MDCKNYPEFIQNCQMLSARELIDLLPGKQRPNVATEALRQPRPRLLGANHNPSTTRIGSISMRDISREERTDDAEQNDSIHRRRSRHPRHSWHDTIPGDFFDKALPREQHRCGLFCDVSWLRTVTLLASMKIH